jgi:signal transduction histidine kinase
MKTSLNQFIKKIETNRMIEALGDAVSIQDTNFKILYQNEKAIQIMDNQVGKFCYKAFENSDYVCEGCPLKISFSDGKARTVERHNPVKKGLIVEITTSVMKDSTGKIIAGIEIVRDITKRKKLDEEQERLVLKMKDDLAKAKKLKGILHMCCSCNKIHEKNGKWTYVDVYIKHNSEAKLSHGYCPECAVKYSPPSS